MKRAPLILLRLVAAFSFAACHSRPRMPADSGTCTVDAGVADTSCSGGDCRALDVAGDAPSGPYQYGLADPSVTPDPGASSTLWLAYSFPEGKTATSPDGGVVGIYTVSSHLAQSSDNGATWSLASDFWPATSQVDPVSGQSGYLSSETPSIVGAATSSGTTWYGVRIRYFLQPVAGYSPDYLNSWTLRVSAASGPSPLALATSPEVVLGENSTSPAWNVGTRLNGLSEDVQHCFIWNNPVLYFQDDTLFLITECVVLDAQGHHDAALSKVSVFSTLPTGAPAAWSWSYEGTLADGTTARELGADLLIQPNVGRASDGSPILLVSPVQQDFATGALTNGGCLALSVASLHPPELVRECDGTPRVRGRFTGPVGAGSCTYAPNSDRGVIYTEAPSPGRYDLHSAPLQP